MINLARFAERPGAEGAFTKIVDGKVERMMTDVDGTSAFSRYLGKKNYIMINKIVDIMLYDDKLQDLGKKARNMSEIMDIK